MFRKLSGMFTSYPVDLENPANPVNITAIKKHLQKNLWRCFWINRLYPIASRQIVVPGQDDRLVQLRGDKLLARDPVQNGWLHRLLGF